MNTKAFIAVGLCFFLGLSILCAAANPKVGKKAPFFRIKSGDDKELTLDMLKGKVAIIFYETKEVVEKNRALKEALKKLGRDERYPSGISVAVGVADCSGAFWPFTRIWRSKLIENSEKEGLTIYGDWDGKMCSDFGLKPKESNVIVVDGKGFIRYSKAGKIESPGIDELKELLIELVSETARATPRTDKRVEKPL